MNKGNSGIIFEILVVLFIVGCLYASQMIYFKPYKSNSISMVKCPNNLKNLYLAMQDYASSHGGACPWVGEGKAPWEHLQILIDEGYVKEPEIFVCPGQKLETPAVKDKNKKFTLSYETCSYTTYARPINFNTDNENTIILADKDIKLHHKDGYCYVRLDTQCAFEPSDKLPPGLIDCSKYAPPGWGESNTGTVILIIVIAGVVLSAAAITVWQIRKRKRAKNTA